MNVLNLILSNFLLIAFFEFIVNKNVMVLLKVFMDFNYNYLNSNLKFNHNYFILNFMKKFNYHYKHQHHHHR